MHWFSASTRPEAADGRALINRWYEKFPDADGRLAARLRSDNDADLYQALDELHLHRLLREQHDDVRYEEDGRGPDFRIYRNGRCVGAIEVLSLFQRQDWTDAQARHGRLADALDARLRPTAGYFVNFQIKAANRDPSPRRFVDFVVSQLAELPPYDQAPESITDRTSYMEEGVRIDVWFSSMRRGAPSLTDPDARITGFGQIVAGFVNGAPRLRARLADKARKLRRLYDVDGVPFLVAVGVHDLTSSTDELVRALYGGEAVDLETGASMRRGDGFFGIDRDHSDGRRRAISGVVVVPGLPVADLPAPDVPLFRNPFAANPWPSDLMAAVTRSWP